MDETISTGEHQSLPRLKHVYKLFVTMEMRCL